MSVWAAVSTADCLALTGGGFSVPALVLGVLLLVGGVGLVLFIRRKGRKVAGAAALVIILLGVLIGVGAPPQAANAASGCKSAAPVSTPTPTPSSPPVVEAASLGDFVWADSNHNGIQDPTEPGVGGIQVTLLDAVTSLPVTTGFGGATINPVQTTDANGNYSFTGLEPGSYIVKLDLTTVVPIDTVTMNLISSNTGYTLQVLTSGGTVVASFSPPANTFSNSFTGTFYGSGHTVRVLDSSNNDVTSTVPGGYGFSSSVTATPAAPKLNPEGQGANPALDSDFNTTTGLTAPVTLLSGENNLDIDGGLQTVQGVSGATGGSGSGPPG